MVKYIKGYQGLGLDLWFSQDLEFTEAGSSEISFAKILPEYGRSFESFRRGPFGQPQSSGLFLSLTHSRSLAVAAVAQARVGIDLEFVRENLNLDAVIRECFSEREMAGFLRLGRRDRLHAFTRVWAQKEALSKGLGLGLQVPFRELEVEVDPSRPLQLFSLGVHGAANDWSLLEFPPPCSLASPAYSFLAVETGERR